MDKYDKALEIMNLVEGRGLHWYINPLPDGTISAGIRIRPDRKTIAYANVRGDIPDAIIEAARDLFGVRDAR